MKRTLRDLAPGEYPEAYEIMMQSFPRVELRGREEERGTDIGSRMMREYLDSEDKPCPVLSIASFSFDPL
jgi:hypothetical protein